MRIFCVIPCLIFWLFSGVALAKTPLIETSVPFVGCSGSGISSPMTAPTGSRINVNLPVNIAAKLAFYGGEYTGFLAPRGWLCMGHDNNHVRTLSAYPPNGVGTTGPIITEETTGIESGTNGYPLLFFMCHYFSNSECDRLKPSKASKNIPDSVSYLNSEITLSKSDKISKLNNFMVEFVTLGNAVGLGSLSFDSLDASPVVQNSSEAASISTSGLLVLGWDNQIKMPSSLSILKIRISNDLLFLKIPILNFSRNCFLAGDKSVCKQNGVYIDGDQ